MAQPRTPAQYQALKAAGVCVRCGVRPAVPLQARCEPCITKEVPRVQAYYAVHGAQMRAAAHARAASRREAPGPNSIACCGTFHAVTAIPFHCPMCQRVLALHPEEVST
jgi:hypothetical protein